MTYIINIVLAVFSALVGYIVCHYRNMRRGRKTSTYTSMMEHVSYQRGYKEGWSAAGEDEDYVKSRYHFMFNPFGKKRD